MKILQVISSGGMYGAEAVILNLCRGLKKLGNGAEIAVFSNDPNPNSELGDAAVREGIVCHVIRCRRRIDREAVRQIRALVRAGQFDVVHAHGYKADIYLYVALRSLDIPLVSTCHTWYDNDPLVTLYGRIDRLVLRNFKRVIAVSEEVRQRLLKAHVYGAKVQLISNGIEVQQFGASMPSLHSGWGAHDGDLVGLVGRLSKEKGVDIFIKAAACVLEKLPETKFAVIGDGPEREELQRLIEHLGIGSSVSLLGRRDDMPGVYASLNLLVCSSRAEGLPVALLEGMASGLPLVATAVGEVPRLVEDGVSGILVPPNDPNSLAQAIIDVLSDEELKTCLLQGARRKVRGEFSAERMTDEYLQVYSSVRPVSAAQQYVNQS